MHQNNFVPRFGQVTSVRPLPEKYCAFINFKTKEAAGRAMHQLQVSSCHTKINVEWKRITSQVNLI